jgi:hypothetical protein
LNLIWRLWIKVIFVKTFGSFRSVGSQRWVWVFHMLVIRFIRFSNFNASFSGYSLDINCPFFKLINGHFIHIIVHSGLLYTLVKFFLICDQWNDILFSQLNLFSKLQIFILHDLILFWDWCNLCFRLQISYRCQFESPFFLLNI